MAIPGNVTHHIAAPTIANAATPISSARQERFLIVQNQGATDVYLGGPGVTTSLGILIKGGQTPAAVFVDAGSVAPWYAITAAGGYTGLVVDEIY